MLKTSSYLFFFFFFSCRHWFGPSGDVRAGGIHTKEAIQLCWSGHREIIYDYGPSAGPGKMS